MQKDGLRWSNSFLVCSAWLTHPALATFVITDQLNLCILKSDPILIAAGIRQQCLRIVLCCVSVQGHSILQPELVEGPEESQSSTDRWRIQFASRRRSENRGCKDSVDEHSSQPVVLSVKTCLIYTTLVVDCCRCASGQTLLSPCLSYTADAEEKRDLSDGFPPMLSRPHPFL